MDRRTIYFIVVGVVVILAVSATSLGSFGGSAPEPAALATTTAPATGN